MELRDSQSLRVVARAEEDAAKIVLNTALDHGSRGLDRVHAETAHCAQTLGDESRPHHLLAEWWGSRHLISLCPHRMKMGHNQLHLFFSVVRRTGREFIKWV